jgi:hypothetical protein
MSTSSSNEKVPPETQSDDKQDYEAWFTVYPSTHRLAGQTVEVIPRQMVEEILEASR